MNEMQKLHELLLPSKSMTTKLDIPMNPGGVWSLDIFYGDSKHIGVAWKEGKGFGLSANPQFYGEGAEEVYDYRIDVLKRIFEIIK